MKRTLPWCFAAALLACGGESPDRGGSGYALSGPSGKQDSSADDPEGDTDDVEPASGESDGAEACPRGQLGCICAPKGCKLGLTCVDGVCEACSDCELCGDDVCSAMESCEICPHDCGSCNGGDPPEPDACAGQDDGVYCGDALGEDPDTRFTCAGGMIAAEEACASGCVDGQCSWCEAGMRDCDGIGGCECDGYCSQITDGLCCDASNACTPGCPLC